MLEELLLKAGVTKNGLAEIADVNQRTVYRWLNEETKIPNLVLQQLNTLAENANSVSRPKETFFKYIDLFAGIGGFRRTFDAIGGECIFTSEWDKYARQTYSDNYVSNHVLAGDIKNFTKSVEDLERIPEHDMLIAGFPCQPFSIAGVSKKNSLGRDHGFRDQAQGTLFFDLAQIIEHHRPSIILLENVKNLTSHDVGKTFKIIKGTLQEELGYHITHKVVDGKGFVPQHRERIFIVGFSQESGYDINNVEFPDANNGPKLNSILHDHIDAEDDYPYFFDGEVNPKYTLSDKLWSYLKAYKKKHQEKGNGFGYGLVTSHDTARTLSARYYKDGSEILVSQDGKNPRRLSPRECSRLMGFDSLTGREFKIPVSDTQAYRQFGNSVVVPVVQTIAESLEPFIKEVVTTNNDQLELRFQPQI